MTWWNTFKRTLGLCQPGMHFKKINGIFGQKKISFWKINFVWNMFAKQKIGFLKIACTRIFHLDYMNWHTYIKTTYNSFVYTKLFYVRAGSAHFFRRADHQIRFRVSGFVFSKFCPDRWVALFTENPTWPIITYVSR